MCGVSLFVFIGLGVTPSFISILSMNAVLLFPILSLTGQALRAKIGKKIVGLCFASLLSLVGAGLTVYIVFGKDAIEKKWAVFVSIGLLSISWVPWLQKKTMEISEQSGDLPTTQTVPGYRRMNISAHGSQNVVFTETNSHWKTLFISSLVKMLLTIPVSIATYYFISEGTKFDDAFNQYRDGWSSDYWDLSKRHSDLFIINILTTVCGYVIGVFACRTCIDRGSFILPLSLATPVAAVIIMVKKSCTLEMFMGSEESDKVCTTEMDQTEIFTIVAIACFALSQCLSTGLLSFKGSTIVLEKETKVGAHLSEIMSEYCFICKLKLLVNLIVHILVLTIWDEYLKV